MSQPNFADAEDQNKSVRCVARNFQRGMVMVFPADVDNCKNIHDYTFEPPLNQND